MVHSQNIKTCLIIFRQLIQLTFTLINSLYVACFSEMFALLSAGWRFATAVTSSYLIALWPRWLSMVSPHCSSMLWLLLSLPSPSYFPSVYQQHQQCASMFIMSKTPDLHTRPITAFINILFVQILSISHSTPHVKNFVWTCWFLHMGNTANPLPLLQEVPSITKPALLDSQTTTCETSCT